ncbi:MAG: hypothetical protein WBD71_15795, partial [Xanthobacteraceae bacterium]
MKRAAVIAGLFYALPMAAALAQTDLAPTTFAKPTGRTVHAALRPKRPLPPIVMPHEFAPPQEAYASFPDSTAAGGPAKPSACQ